MAQAPGHKLGQIIGETLELAIHPPLQEFADQHGLYLDSQGERAARPGKRVRWTDDLGNKHDLDHVLERGGTDTQKGVPVAFIETAWRRYTKHSRNKAQEIQGAILPLLATWAHARPFAGVVLAGEWTQGSLVQLESNGFSVLHIPYEAIVAVFQRSGIDILYGEASTDEFLQDQIVRWEALTPSQRIDLGDSLRSTISSQLSAFLGELAETVLRKIASVSVLPLHGQKTACESVEEAISFIRDHKSTIAGSVPLVRVEVIVRYDNGDRVTADFGASGDAISFLQSFR